MGKSLTNIVFVVVSFNVSGGVRKEVANIGICVKEKCKRRGKWEDCCNGRWWKT